MSPHSKISLLGKGKTGSSVVELLEAKGRPTTIFDSAHPPSLEELQATDVAVAFVPGKAFEELIPLLLESRLPLVCGSTGVTWPADLDERLKERHVPWIRGSNFSCGMLLIRRMLSVLSQSPQIFSDYTVEIEETHHEQKRDAPSGTALKWQDWSSLSPPIKSLRCGDVAGKHQLTLESSSGEKIVLTHEALNRKLFASGALWAAEELLTDPPSGGLHFFETFAEERLFGSL